jgi:hypothetical protein
MDFKAKFALSLLMAVSFFPLLNPGSTPGFLPEEERLASTPSMPPLRPVKNLPIEPLAVLTVCPEGPPTCRFASLQEAIESAPETPPVTTWETPPKLPLIHIAPGLYEERVVILKNVWLKGADRESVTLRGPDHAEAQGSAAAAIFIAGADHLAVAVEALTIEGPIRIVGSVSGVLLNNRFQPDRDGNGGVELNGLLNLNLENNLFTHTGIYMTGALPLFEDGLEGFAGGEGIRIGANVFLGS